MRQLTKTEIKTRPLWAKSYAIHAQSGEPMFYAYLGYGATPIPCEEFDIEAFEADDMVKFYIDSDGDLEFDGFDESYLLRKDSAIAIAKHFKLTAEDLR